MNSSAPPTRAYQRNRTSSSIVRWSDRIAKHIITIGGIGTILVVLMVVLVLLGNVWPLFRGADIQPLARVALRSADTHAVDNESAKVVAFGIDEYSELVWMLHSDQRLAVWSIAPWQLLTTISPEVPVAPDVSITTVQVARSNRDALIGFSDGSVRPLSIAIEVEFQKRMDLDPDLAERLLSGPQIDGGAIYRLTAENLVRRTRVGDVNFQDPISVFATPITALDCNVQRDTSGFTESTTWMWGAATEHRLALGRIEETPGMLGGSASTEVSLWRSPEDASSRTRQRAQRAVMVTANGDSLESIDETGEITWWNTAENSLLTEKHSYVTITGSDSQLSCAEPLLGRSTWLLGATSGHVEAVAITATETDQELLSIHRLRTESVPVVDLAASPSSRLFAALTSEGTVHLQHATSERLLSKWQIPRDGESVAPGARNGTVQFNASGTSLAVVADEELWVWKIDASFPEASLGSFFLPVWYEGYVSPQHRWQSSTGSIEGETKFGLWPLIFGTLKATLYSMLLAAPIALLAAIYGSEFMNSTWRLRFKPLIELMASVPSVVLGFLAAMIVAPWLREYLAWTLLSCLLTILFLLLAAHLWMLIPGQRAIPLRRYRLPLMFLIPPLAMVVASGIALPIERWIFQTTMVDWLGDPQLGAWPGWFLLSLVPVGMAVAWWVSGPLSRWVESRSRNRTATAMAFRSLGIFVVCCGLSLAVAMAIASGVSSIGWDARGSVLGPYQERNALLVGGVLGFAIIPLIYTLADDALQSVPQHLRSASLACGATIWQTTTRVVVPTAMSGLFSALMIGFGRAIGETMVVLMAAGNTPLMDVNPFNGYRTLSATLATELPEAARGSTHYHTLFLAALLLFAFTLIVNSCAEWVRLRFRKRAYQL